MSAEVSVTAAVGDVAELGDVDMQQLTRSLGEELPVRNVYDERMVAGIVPARDPILLGI
ncbi:hypothetical protein [Arthrobacter sp. UNC362MFTsu5.1]|uniref:hypothetical protein n=1 Tax=Arthrobacter sp. UNC362MFTsu5.1 TaxID=1449044 RepID=UPI000A98B6AC|nr:hypothetical protein [Arthrobacter sp. UNC362MFTsu5.1]